MKNPNLSVNEELKKEGYSQEERYFYKLNRELIEKRRKQSDLESSVHTTDLKTPKVTNRFSFILNILKKLFKPSEEPPRLF